MLVVLAIISVGLLGLIIYLAFSSKSSKILKLVAFIALGLIALSMGINITFLIIGPGENGTDGLPLPIFAETPPAQTRSENWIETVIFLSVFLVIMTLIIVLSTRDRRKKEGLTKQSGKSAAFSRNDDLDAIESNSNNIDLQVNEDDFDLGLGSNEDR